MAYIEYQECEVEIGGQNVLAKSATITTSANVKANRVYGGKFRKGQKYSATSFPTATLDLNYYIMENHDHIEQMTGQKYANGSFCGINFSGAALTSYSVNIQPYKVIEYKATFVLYSGLDQRSLGAEPVEDPSVGTDLFYEKFANGAYTELVNFNRQNIGIDFPSNISYQVTCERIPKYVIGDEYPESVALGRVNRRLSVEGENIGSLITFSGKDFATVEISPRSIDNVSRGQTVTCDGIIKDQNLAVSSEGVLAGSINIEQSLR